MAPGISESYVQYREYVIEFTCTTARAEVGSASLALYASRYSCSPLNLNNY